MAWWRWIAAFVLLSAVGFFLGGYTTDVYRKLLLWMTLALGFNFLFGIAGQIAFSHFAFYGIGAYSVVILAFHFGLPLPLAIPLAAALCAVLALAVAIPSNRLEGFYLALATIAFSQLFIIVLNEGGDVTGGTGGLTSYRLPPAYDVLPGGPWFTMLIVFVMLATFAVLWRLDRSWFGRACRAVRDNPEAAAAMGVDVARTKVLAFTLTSTLAGVAGMAYAFVDNTVNPPTFSIENSFMLLFMIVIGGAGRFAGAIVGAALLYFLPLWLSPVIGHHHALVFGLLVVAVILWQPSGLVGIYDALARRWRGGEPA